MSDRYVTRPAHDHPDMLVHARHTPLEDGTHRVTILALVHASPDVPMTVEIDGETWRWVRGRWVQKQLRLDQM